MSATTMPTSAPTAPAEFDALLRCLSPELRQPTTTITRIAAGMSGAGVYRVETPDGQFVLKTTAQDEPVGVWRSKVRMQQAVAEAGIAPKVFHADENRRAVVSELIVDRSFPNGG
ncbi:MAG: hypothetical protein ABJB74_01990 [Gemmatimonas sp.]